MPSPKNNRQKPASGAESKQASNEALRILFPGRRPSWMTDTSTKISNPSHERGSSRPQCSVATNIGLTHNTNHQESPSALPSTIPTSTSQTTKSAQKVQAASPSQASVLLSPALTSEPSPVSGSTHNDDHSSADAGMINIHSGLDGSSAFSQPAIQEVPYDRMIRGTRPGVENGTFLPQLTAGNAQGRVGLQTETLALNVPSDMANNRASNVQPTPPEVQSAANPRVPAKNLKRTAAVFNSTHPEDLSSGDARHEIKRGRQRLSHNRSPAQAKEMNNIISGWCQTLSARIQQNMSLSHAPLNHSVEELRFGLLHSACEKGDIFFVILHRYFSLWSLRQESLQNIINIDSAAMDKSFQLLSVVLRESEAISRPNLVWLAAFPENLDTVVNFNADVRIIAQQKIAVFLKKFAEVWEPLLLMIIDRRFPMLACEGRDFLMCPSLFLLEMFFTASRRKLGIRDGAYASELNNLFSTDLKSEGKMRIESASPEHLANARSRMALQYREIVERSVHQPEPPQRGPQHHSDSANPASQPPSTTDRPPSQHASTHSSSNTLNQNPANASQNAAIASNARSPAHSLGVNTVAVDDNPEWNARSLRPIVPQPGTSTHNEYNIPAHSRPPILPSNGPQTVDLSNKNPRQSLPNNGPWPSEILPAAPLSQQSSGQGALSNISPVNSSQFQGVRRQVSQSVHSTQRQHPTQQPNYAPQFQHPGRLQHPHQHQANSHHPPHALYQAQRQHQPQPVYQARPTHAIHAMQHPHPIQPQAYPQPQPLPFPHLSPYAHTQSGHQPPRPSPTPTGRLQLPSQMQNPRISTPSPAPQQATNPPSRGPQTQPVAAPDASISFQGSSQPQRVRHYTHVQNGMTIQDPRTLPAIPEIDYPRNPYDWTSVQPSLHLLQLRSPKRISSSPGEMPSYQYIERLVTEPLAVPPMTSLRILQFSITQDEFSQLATISRPEGYPVSQYADGSRRYRLRLCKQPLGTVAVDEGAWAVCPAYWPESVHIAINNTPVLPRRKQHFSRDMPIELTDLLKPGGNLVMISIPDTAPNISKDSVYFIAVEVVNIVGRASLVTMVHGQQHVLLSETTDEIKKRLAPPNQDLDDIIVENDTLCVSLADPFSSSMFVVPVRGVNCKHLECFDLANWLETRRSKPPRHRESPSLVDIWRCPICDIDARPSSLRVDDFFVGVREKLLQSGRDTVKRINIASDGTWTAIEEDSDDTSRAASAQARGASADTRSSGKAPATRIPETIVILDD